MKAIKLSVSAAFGLLTTLTLSATVFAAGNGYTPGQSFGTSQTGGGTLSVVTAQTVSSNATTVSATAGPASLTIAVPSGALPAGAQVVVAKGNVATVSGIPSGSRPLEDFNVSFLGISNKNISPTKPITLTIKNSSIKSGAVVYKATAGGLRKVSAIAKTGEVDITFMTDPEFVVVQPGVANATQPVTGMPFAEVLAAGALLVVIGSTLVLYRRKTR